MVHVYIDRHIRRIGKRTEEQITQTTEATEHAASTTIRAVVLRQADELLEGLHRLCRSECHCICNISLSLHIYKNCFSGPLRVCVSRTPYPSPSLRHVLL